METVETSGSEKKTTPETPHLFHVIHWHARLEGSMHADKKKP
jgi:hypothetical protein